MGYTLFKIDGFYHVLMGPKKNTPLALAAVVVVPRNKRPNTNQTTTKKRRHHS